MTDPNDSAFAKAGSARNYSRDGLTKREYFAGLAMQGIVSQVKFRTIDEYKEICRGSVIFADEIIKQLNEQPCQQAE